MAAADVCVVSLWSELLSSAEGIGQHFSIGEFEHAAGGDTASEPSNADGIILQQVGDEQGGAITFECWISGHDNFGDALFADAVHELVDGEIFRSDAFKWCDATPEDVVHTAPDT